MINTKNNVLHIIDTLWLGGAQKILKSLFEENANKDKLYLLALRKTAHITNIDSKSIYFVEKGGKYNFRKALKRVLFIINDKQIKSLHCHLPKSQLLGWIIKRFYYPKIKLIFHEQGDILNPIPLSSFIYILASKKIDAVICCSDYVKKTINKRSSIPSEKLHLVYNFTSFNEAKILSKKNKTKETPFIIGFAGRIVKRKGWKDFLEACISLKSEHPMLNIEIALAGVGREEKSLKKVIKKNQSQLYIKHHGFVKEMSAFYEKIDLLCVPSHWEPLGMVHIEAMSFGVPIIASDVPGMNEILQHNKNALLFKIKDKERLKKYIFQLINDGVLYEELSNEGIITAKAFSYANFEQKIQEVYTKIDV